MYDCVVFNIENNITSKCSIRLVKNLLCPVSLLAHQYSGRRKAVAKGEKKS